MGLRVAVLGVLVAAGLGGPASAIASQASGAGALPPFDATVFSFGAHGDVVSATGAMTFQDFDANAPGRSGEKFQFVAHVQCLQVVGNRAYVTGEIEHAVPARFEHLGLRFTVEDNGEPGAGRDRFEAAIEPFPSPVCGLAPFVPPPGAVISRGNLQVRD